MKLYIYYAKVYILFFIIGMLLGYILETKGVNEKIFDQYQKDTRVTEHYPVKNGVIDE